MENAGKRWKIYYAISELLASFDLHVTDRFISECVQRVIDDASDDWNEDDCKIAIRNTLSETIQKYF